MNGCFITDFVVFSQTKQTMESLEIAAFDAIILIKTRHLHFPLKLGLRKSTKKDKIKTEHAVPFLIKNYRKFKRECCVEWKAPVLLRQSNAKRLPLFVRFYLGI